MEPFKMTEEFHEIFDPRKPDQPKAFSPEEALYRSSFKLEEIVEFLAAASDGDEQLFADLTESLHQALDQAVTKIKSKKATAEDPLVGQVDALTDLLYLTYGSFSLLGVNPQPMLEIVHQANMGKLFPDGKPHYDPVTNKVLKPASWAAQHAPEKKLLDELRRQGYKM